jgi:hypothetical protein
MNTITSSSMKKIYGRHTEPTDCTGAQPQLPEEVGLRLLKPPTAPRELPSMLFIRNVNGIPTWRHFLVE